MKNVILIDDDDVIKNVLSKVLRQRGYNVVHASDGLEGAKKLDLMKYDLVLTDLMMPYMNGFELITNVKSHPNSKDAKVIVFSSINHQESINNTRALGVDKYMVKPIIISDFLNVLHEVLEGPNPPR